MRVKPRVPDLTKEIRLQVDAERNAIACPVDVDKTVDLKVQHNEIEIPTSWEGLVALATSPTVDLIQHEDYVEIIIKDKNGTHKATIYGAKEVYNVENYSSLPNEGKREAFYLDLATGLVYYWDPVELTWKEIGTSAVKIDELRAILAALRVEDLADGEDYATKEYVEEHGGKINTISVNGQIQPIDENKNVNIEAMAYTAGNGIVIENEVIRLDELILECGTSTTVI